MAVRLAAREVFRQPVRRLAGTGRLSYPLKMRFSRLASTLTGLALLTACSEQQAPVENSVEESGPTKGLERDKAGQAIPDIELKDADDEAATLADAKGKPLLVNIWATWCAPCVKELPTLQALAANPGAPRVIAVSQDMAPRGSVDAFLDKNKLAGLEVWHDPKMELSGAIDAQVLPTTILYDAQGKEVWRYVGDLDWTGPEAAKLLADAGQPRG
jgi:thiol-disulfide isomerase/thioredoxin